MNTPKKTLYFDWVDALKAFAILGILLNHFEEVFGPMVWFTNPSEDWPGLSSRVQNIIPAGQNWLERAFYMLGWLGDSGPGVFILLSGFGLALSALQKPDTRMNLGAFYGKRLKRIFPLYVAIHILTIAVGILVFNRGSADLNLMSLMSFLGLRFTDSLFFYINPSWWFIWLILQLYIVFPLLFKMMKKLGVLWFFMLTLGFTILSRGLGLEGFRYSDSLYFWMTGIFFGTRLVEFTLGMALAAVLLRREEAGKNMPRLGHILVFSLLIYLLGLAASIFWLGTLVSNLLVTTGMCGLFYVAWCAVKKYLAFLTKPVIWIGVNSFGVFLLHQAPINWTVNIIENPTLRFLAVSLILVLSFPVALIIEKLVDRVVAYMEQGNAGQERQRAALITAVLLIAGLALLECIPSSRYVYHAFSALLLGLGLAALVMELKTPLKQHFLAHVLLLTGFIAAVARLFVLSSVNSMYLLVVAGGIACVMALFYRWAKSRLWAWMLSFALLGGGVLFLEMMLRMFKPLETPDRWGEYPALQIHPTRIYSLKPNVNKRLKYNNYNYRLKTNSQGLASPEIDVERPDARTLRILIAGDAFSMPEGVPYESSYPALLEKSLQEQLPSRTVQVINGGVTGYGPNETLPQLAELIPLYRPDIVIYQFFVNEFMEISLSREDRLYNIGLLSNRSRLKREIARSQILAYKSVYQRELNDLIKRKESDWGYYKLLMPLYEKDTDIYQSGNIQKMEGVLAAMKNICEEQNAAFLMLFVPGQVEVSAPEDIAYYPQRRNLNDTALFDMKLPYKEASAITDSLNIPLINMTPALKSGPEQPVYFPASWHWNKEGHKVAAEVVAEELKARGLLK